MRVIIIGSGRVGAAIAHHLSARGHNVCVVDSDPDSLLRLGENWSGEFYVGEALDSELLERISVDKADAFIASTDDDNTNLVISQVAQRRYRVPIVVVRVFDPDKAAWYSKRGLRVVCPTLRAIDEMIEAVDPNGGERIDGDAQVREAVGILETGADAGISDAHQGR